MSLGVVFVFLMAVGIGVGSYGVYNFETKRYSVMSYGLGAGMLVPMLFFAFSDELMALTIVTLLFGSVLYGWMWVCYGFSMLFYGSVTTGKRSSGLDFNDGGARA